MDRSITFKVSRSLQKEWAKTMAESNRSISSKAEGIIKHLRNESYQHTSDYILRRFIQKNYKEYVDEAERETGITCVDLSSNMNLPWDKKCIEVISEKLFKNLKRDYNQTDDIAADTKLLSTITKKQWTDYLSEHKSIHRKQIFNIALTLGMDIENTQKLLMSCGAEPYNLHNVLDVICLYCQSSSEDKTKTSAHVWKIYTEYNMEARSGGNSKRDGSQNGSADKRPGNYGFTLEMQEKVNEKIDDESFLKELLARQEYFKGYSKSQWSKYHQFARFLAVLYPEYIYRHSYYESLADHKSKIKSNLIEEEISREVPHIEMELLIEKNGEAGDSEFLTEKKQVPDMNKLLTAIFYDATWFSGNNGSKDKLKGIAKAYKDVPELIHTFCDNYKVRAMAIHNQTKPVDRNDVLLFAFFYISWFIHLSSRMRSGGKSSKSLEKTMAGIIESIETTADRESAFDQVILEVTEVLGDPDNIKKDKYNTILKCLNLCLNGFGFVETYLPNPFDRFIVLSLMSDEPMSVSAEVLESIRIERETAGKSAGKKAGKAAGKSAGKNV